MPHYATTLPIEIFETLRLAGWRSAGRQQCKAAAAKGCEMTAVRNREIDIAVAILSSIPTP